MPDNSYGNLCDLCTFKIAVLQMERQVRALRTALQAFVGLDNKYKIDSVVINKLDWRIAKATAEVLLRENEKG